MTLGFSSDKAEEDIPGNRHYLYWLKLTLFFLVLYNSASAMFPPPYLSIFKGDFKTPWFFSQLFPNLLLCFAAPALCCAEYRM